MPHSDRVLVRGLKIQAIVGILDAERLTSQPLSLDLDLHVDFAAIEHPEDYEHIVDYAAVSKLAIDLAVNGEYLLLETLGEDLCTLLFETFPIEHIRLLIEKPEAVAEARWVGIEMERSRVQ